MLGTHDQIFEQDDIDDDEGGASNELLRELTDAADGREISSAAREILHNAAMGEVDRRSKVRSSHEHASCLIVRVAKLMGPY